MHDSGFLEGVVRLGVPPGVAIAVAGQILGAYRLHVTHRPGRHGQRLAGGALRRPIRRPRRGQAAEHRADGPRPAKSGSGAKGTILARLTHPHIAHLIDAGVSPTGQPYLVLEHVERPDHRPLLRRARARHRGAPAAVSRRAGGRRPRARQPDRAPRHQAGQRAGQRRRPGQAARLRHRQAARGRRASGTDRGSASQRADARRRRAR